MFRRPVFQISLFCLGLLVFNWPLLSVFNGPPKASYFDFFLAWLGFVAVYRCIAWAAASRDKRGKSDGSRADRL